MKNANVVLAIVLGAVVIAVAILLRPTAFDQCMRIIKLDIERQARSATLDPRDVEAQAARTCAGS